MTPTLPAGEIQATFLGAVLVGGASRRMGRDKALLEHRGMTLAGRSARALAPWVERVHWLGAGPVGAADLATAPDAPVGRVADRAGVAGPLAGLLGLFDHRADVWWLVVACDLPRLEASGIAWLRGEAERAIREGAIAVLPRALGRPQPLFAAYGPGSVGALEALALGGVLSPRALIERPDVATPAAPGELEEQWTNVNTPDEWRPFAGG